MAENKRINALEYAGVAGGRANTYGLLVNVFGSLPDGELIARIKDGRISGFIDDFANVGSDELGEGVRLIKAYQKQIANRAEKDILKELSIDRTVLVRGTGDQRLKPPYEGLYRTDCTMAAAALEINEVYRATGLALEEGTPESPDFLCIELDFLKNLCLQEQSQWSSGQDGRQTLTIEYEFISAHMGRWIKNYCNEADKFAVTDFYRGFLKILSSFTSLDREYLGAVLSETPQGPTNP